MEMNMDFTELLIPAFFGVFAFWFVFHIRRRMRSADKSFASTHRKITRRLAGGDETLETQEKEPKAITIDDWTRGRDGSRSCEECGGTHAHEVRVLRCPQQTGC